MSASVSPRPLPKAQNYLSRGRNVLHRIFEKHFKDFCNIYEDQYVGKYGRFHLDRIMSVSDHFIDCGDYLNGVARIRCKNPDCGHDYFRPFSCKGFYLCPSCSQKRTILMAELTQHIPPKGIQYIRRYGLYASRTRGKWVEHPEIVKYAPERWKINQLESFSDQDFSEDETECNISTKACRKAWARMLAKIYEINPYTCPWQHGMGEQQSAAL